jgi:hypothetical protein
LLLAAEIVLTRLPKKFDTSGKSPAYVQHRKNSARAGKLVAGFLMRRDVSRHCDIKRQYAAEHADPGDRS